MATLSHDNFELKDKLNQMEVPLPLPLDRPPSGEPFSALASKLNPMWPTLIYISKLFKLNPNYNCLTLTLLLTLTPWAGHHRRH
jgi:hypothetical protein